MRWTLPVLLTLVLVAGCGDGGPTPEPEGDGGQATIPEGGAGGPTDADLLASYDKALDYLAGRFQDDGLIHAQGNPSYGVTALVLAGFANRPGGIRPGDRELLDRTLDKLVAVQQDNGGIYTPGELANYTTCAAVMALKAGGRDKDAPTIERASAFLKGLQFDEQRGVEPSSTEYGGLGYGSHERPDLSNTQFSLEALRAAGVPDDDPVFKKVLAFLQRTQNRTESNPGGAELPDGRKITRARTAARATVPRRARPASSSCPTAPWRSAPTAR
jgi:squalene-hopene/tetraprenyl-beta-curcumene cyclase